MTFSLGMYVLVLVIVSVTAEAAKQNKLIDTINICKRNDPDLSKCFLKNFNNVLPMLKDGVPEMNIVPIDPFQANNVRVDFIRMQSMKIAASMQKLTVYGWSKGYAHECDAWLTPDGLQLYIDLHIPEAMWKASYNAVGNLLLIPINTTGDFYGTFTGIKAQALWNSTLYVRNNMEYLTYTSHIIDLTVEKMVLHFHHLFGNNTQLNDRIDQMISDNANVMREEGKPVFVEVVRVIIQKIVNDFHTTFPYDLLYPK